MTTNSSFTTIGATLAEATADSPDRPFLIDQDGTTTFAELKLRADMVSQGLIERGYSSGDRLAVAVTNRREWAEVFFGAAQIGVVVVTLNVRYRESELEYMLNQSESRGVVAHASLAGFDYVGFYQDFMSRIPTVKDLFFLDHPSYESLVDHEANISALEVATNGVVPSDPAVILYTSGTTGRPKGATITHQSILSSAIAQVEHFATAPNDSMAGHLPFNHVGGITCTLVGSLVARSSIHLIESFSAAEAIRVLSTGQLTTFSGVPTMFVLLLANPELAKVDTHKIRNVVVGGSNVEPALLAKLKVVFPSARLFNLYGLSETSGSCIISSPTDTDEQITSTIGEATGEYELRCVDLNMNPVPKGSEGELQVRGDCVISGYWRMPEETSAAISDDGWLSTGDMAIIRQDDHVVLKGRKKEMFIQGGYNVYPVEVENVLTQHPSVAMAAGIPVDDSHMGEVGRYYIQLRVGHAATPEELIEFCTSRLADYKLPRQIVFVEEFPLTPVGKIQKSVLKERITAQVHSVRPGH